MIVKITQFSRYKATKCCNINKVNSCIPVRITHILCTITDDNVNYICNVVLNDID